MCFWSNLRDCLRSQTSQREEAGAETSIEVSEGSHSAVVRAAQQTHPLFDTGLLVKGLEERLGGLVRARKQR